MRRGRLNLVWRSHMFLGHRHSVKGNRYQGMCWWRFMGVRPRMAIEWRTRGFYLATNWDIFPVFAKSKATLPALLVPSMLRNSSSLSRLLGLPTAVTLIPAFTKRSDKSLPIPNAAPVTSMCLYGNDKFEFWRVWGELCFWNDVKWKEAFVKLMPSSYWECRRINYYSMWESHRRIYTWKNLRPSLIRTFVAWLRPFCE